MSDLSSGEDAMADSRKSSSTLISEKSSSMLMSSPSMAISPPSMAMSLRLGDVDAVGVNVGVNVVNTVSVEL